MLNSHPLITLLLATLLSACQAGSNASENDPLAEARQRWPTRAWSTTATRPASNATAAQERCSLPASLSATNRPGWKTRLTRSCAPGPHRGSLVCPD